MSNDAKAAAAPRVPAVRTRTAYVLQALQLLERSRSLLDKAAANEPTAEQAAACKAADEMLEVHAAALSAAFLVEK